MGGFSCACLVVNRLPKSSDGDKLPPLLAALAILNEGYYFVDINN